MKSLFPIALAVASVLVGCEPKEVEPKDKNIGGDPTGNNNVDPVEARCAASCAMQNDCLRGMDCQEAAIGTDEACTAQCVDAGGISDEDWEFYSSLTCEQFDALVCMDATAAQVCGCPTDNCPAGQFCFPYPEEGVGLCFTDEGDVPTGTACAANTDCAAGTQVCHPGVGQCMTLCQQSFP